MHLYTECTTLKTEKYSNMFKLSHEDIYLIYLIGLAHGITKGEAQFEDGEELLTALRNGFNPLEK